VFDAEAGATIAAAINAYMTHDPPDTPPELRRTVAQRRADALYDIATRALASPGASESPDVAGARPHVIARVNLTDLPATHTATTAARLRPSTVASIRSRPQVAVDLGRRVRRPHVARYPQRPRRRAGGVRRTPLTSVA
jgi:hypothetical protein